MSDEQLLLLQLPGEDDDDDEKNRKLQNPPRRKAVLRVRNPRYVTSGAANVMKDWPSHHAYSNFWLMLATILLLIFFIFLLLSYFRKNPLGSVSEEQKKLIADDLSQIKRLYRKIFCSNKKTTNEICRESSDKDRALIEFDNSTSGTQHCYSLISDSNIFYVNDDNTPFSHFKACAMESALRYAPDKQFFLINLKKCSPKTAQSMEDSTNKLLSLTFNLTNVLKNDYPNLKTVMTDGCKYFSSSPFQGLWQDASELAYQAAQILTVWRFGGMVLSLDSLVANRKLFDQIGSSVEVGKLVLRSRLQCNKYVGELMLEMRKKMVPAKNSTMATSISTGDLISDVIDKSLQNYCHNLVGCQGVRKMEDSRICDQIEETCYLLNLKRWRKENSDWKNLIRYFCPIITKRSLNFTLYDE